MPAATSLPPQAALLELSRSLGGVWAVLMRGLGLWAMLERGVPLPPLATQWAQRLIARLQALLALAAAGGTPRLYPPRPRPPAATPAPPPEAEAPPRENPPLPRLPRKIGWLIGRHVEINIAANHLRLWLADPATQAVLAELPQARRPIAVLCRALAIPPWPHPPLGPLPPPPPRVRKPRPPKPRRETLAQVRASVWHHRCIETDTGFVRPGRRPWWMPPKGWRRD